jgi:hypothetical protein
MKIAQPYANKILTLQNILQAVFNINIINPPRKINNLKNSVWYCIGLQPINTEWIQSEDDITLFGLKSVKVGDKWPKPSGPARSVIIAKKLIVARKYLPLTKNQFAKENIFYLQSIDEDVYITILNTHYYTYSQLKIHNPLQFCTQPYVVEEYLEVLEERKDLIRTIYNYLRNKELEDLIKDLQHSDYIIDEYLRAVLRTLNFTKAEKKIYTLNNTNLVTELSLSHP